MKQLLTSFLLLFFLSSCNSQSDPKKLAEGIKQTVETTAGSIPTQEGGLTMKATIGGKAWVAAGMIPAEAAGRIVGSYNKVSISLPYDRRYLYAGKKVKFSDHQAVDLFNDDEVGIWGGRKGEMEITKVDDNWAEGIFYFTGSTLDGSKTIAVTDGFFRIAVPKSK
ncbi:MAG TPA: hypothetical protein VGN00_04310 [Puia sp.]|jgi:hypothetical protein